jgi:hypothetical protein
MVNDPFLPLVLRIGVWFFVAFLIVILCMVLNTAVIVLVGRGALPPGEHWATQFWLVFLAGCSRPSEDR